MEYQKCVSGLIFALCPKTGKFWAKVIYNNIYDQFWEEKPKFVYMKDF